VCSGTFLRSRKVTESYGVRVKGESEGTETDQPLPLAGVVSLAGVNDLARSLALGNRTDTLKLSGIESQSDAAARFAETDPSRLLPFGLPQALIVGSLDAEWRITMTRACAEDPRSAGDGAAGHGLNAHGRQRQRASTARAVITGCFRRETLV